MIEYQIHIVYAVSLPSKPCDQHLYQSSYIRSVLSHGCHNQGKQLYIIVAMIYYCKVVHKYSRSFFPMMTLCLCSVFLVRSNSFTIYSSFNVGSQLV